MVDVERKKDARGGSIKIDAPGVKVDVERKKDAKGGVKVKAPGVDIEIKK